MWQVSTQPEPPAKPLPEPDAARLRDAIFELTPGIGAPFPTADQVADHTGLSLDDVQPFLRERLATYAFLLEPMVNEAQRKLGKLSVRLNPTIAEQRVVIETAVRIAIDHPQQTRLLFGLIDHEGDTAGNDLADSVFYLTHLRLVGMEHEHEPVMQRRVAFVRELIGVAVISHRHHLYGEVTPEAIEEVVVACLGILNPPTER